MPRGEVGGSDLTWAPFWIEFEGPVSPRLLIALGEGLDELREDPRFTSLVGRLEDQRGQWGGVRGGVSV